MIIATVNSVHAQESIPYSEVQSGCIKTGNWWAKIIQSQSQADSLAGSFYGLKCNSYGIEKIDYSKYTVLVYKVNLSGIYDSLITQQFILSKDKKEAIFSLEVIGAYIGERFYKEKEVVVKFLKLPSDTKFVFKRKFINTVPVSSDPHKIKIVNPY